MSNTTLTLSQIDNLRISAGEHGDDTTILLCACARGDMDDAADEYEDGAGRNPDGTVNYRRVIADYYPAFNDAWAVGRWNKRGVSSVSDAHRILAAQLAA